MTGDRFAALATLEEPKKRPAPERPEPKSRPAPAQPAQELKTLGARLPLAITREFDRRKLDAEEHAKLRKVTSEVGLEALVRLLRDPDILDAWHRELLVVVDEQD